jgi:ABC-type taurine transport system ATPase subunit
LAGAVALAELLVLVPVEPAVEGVLLACGEEVVLLGSTGAGSTAMGWLAGGLVSNSGATACWLGRKMARYQVVTAAINSRPTIKILVDWGSR